MKILWFTWKDRSHPLAGGAEVVNEELAARLAADGHEVTFIVGGYPGAAPETTGSYRVIRVGNRYTVYLAAFWYYRRHLRGWADLIIDECNTMPFFTRFYAREPTVMFFHMLCRRIWFYEFPPVLNLLGYLAEPVYLWLLRNNSAITVSESTRQDLVRVGFQDHHISLISEGTELTPVTSLHLTPKYTQPTLLSLGSIRPMKRTLHHLAAFEQAKAKLPTLQLIVAGSPEGRYGRQVLKAIKASPYAQDITVLGRITKAKKSELMQRCHLILVTSVKEGWGLIVTEAASQGTPAVVYNVDGLRDAVRHGQTGLHTTSNTPAALADAAVQLLTTPAAYQSMRQAGWEWSQEITFDRSYADFKQAIGL